MFFLGEFHITKHVCEQYAKRIKNKNFKSIKKCINYDLRTLNIKKVIYDGEFIYVFTKGFREFIFVKNHGILFLKTTIKRNLQDTEYTIQKRLNRKQERELIAN